ncbi:MAG: transcription antitermination factor NusB [Blastocatellia bacterium AA13]|nr:MAG: transcription antitermination factor NusB [Blastocatellia bacterium AA13]
MGARRKARICALQMLFQYDIARPRVADLCNLYWDELGDEVGMEARDFSNQLALGAIARLDEIDEMIKRRAENWRISRMAVVDRNILRLAIYEFLNEHDTPKTVVINEALEIARRFSTFEATQFINGILDAIKRDIESNPAAQSAASSHSG